MIQAEMVQKAVDSMIQAAGGNDSAWVQKATLSLIQKAVEKAAEGLAEREAAEALAAKAEEKLEKALAAALKRESQADGMLDTFRGL